MTLLIYDYEVFKYDWCVTILDLINNKTYYIENDADALKDFHQKNEQSIWIGYNNRSYDQWIHKGILCGFDPKAINDYIIIEGHKGFEYSDLLNKIKMINFDVMQVNDGGLKSLEAFMGNNIHETSIDFNIDRKLTPEELAENRKYNLHDVEQTAEVFIERYNEFEAHLALCKLFNRPLQDMGKTQAQLASKILKASAHEYSDDWDIRLPDTLQLSKYKYIADWFLNPANHRNDATLKTNVCGCEHIFGLGGLHGAPSQFVYTCKSDELMIMADVTQLYPSIMYEYKLLSRSCPSSAYDTLKMTIDTSVRLKAEGKKKEREPYKRLNNICYGAEGDKYNAMNDPLHRTLVCVFGQLLILDLIEKIEKAGIVRACLNSNTDGIMFLIDRKDFETFDDIVYNWEQRTRLTMEFDFFKTIIQKDVNNYVMIEPSGKYKAKGAYVKGLSRLSYDLPIVNKALKSFFIDNIPVEKTIGECDELIEFQKVVKVSSKYKFGYHNGIAQRDRVYRVFASKDTNDGCIGKQKEAGATIEKFANTPEHCFIDNGDIKEASIPAKLDKQWYIELAKKRIIDFIGEENYNKHCLLHKSII